MPVSRPTPRFSVPRRKRVALLPALLCLAAAPVLTPAVAHAANASDMTGVYIDSPSQGAVARGPVAHLTVYFDADTCMTISDTGYWLIDGHKVGIPVQDTQFPPEVGPGPNMPAGAYVYDDQPWDSTTVANGTHTATYVYNGRHCTDDTYYTEQTTTTFTVNNQPIGIAFTLPGGSHIHGLDTTLGVTTTPQGSPVTNATFTGTLLDSSPDADTSAPYTTDLDTGDADNGSYPVTATATDAAGITTAATLSLTVDNHSTLKVRAPATARRTQGAKVTIISSQEFGDGQDLVIQQRIGTHWSTVAPVHIGPSGRRTGTLMIHSRGLKTFRVKTAEGNYWPGLSGTFTIRSL